MLSAGESSGWILYVQVIDTTSEVVNLQNRHSHSGGGHRYLSLIGLR